MNVANIVQQIDREIASLIRARKALTGLEGGSRLASSRDAGKRAFTASSRAKMAAAQRARWAKFRAAKGQSADKAEPVGSKAARIVSAAARKKMAEAQKARWARFRAEKKIASK